MINAFNNAICYGFEFEKINPTLEKLLRNKNIISSWAPFEQEDKSFNINRLKNIYGKLNFKWWTKL